MAILIITRPVMNYVEMEGTMDNMNVMMETELLLMDVLNSVSKKNKALRSLVAPPWTSSPMFQLLIDMSASLETSIILIIAMISVEMASDTMILMFGTREGTHIEIWRSSVMMATSRMGMGVTLTVE